MNLRGILMKVRAVELMEGGGFKVRRPFPGQIPDRIVDPFLLIDEMGPAEYEPGEAVGAPDHPHRGFETVTYMLDGVFEHKDSAGNSGRIAPGDVQWMTAGSGVVHSEMPSSLIMEKGGRVHGFQIWINLPAKNKMDPPRYQEVPDESIPTATSEDGRVSVKIIAGEAMGKKSVIDTHTPITFQHWIINPGSSHTQELKAGINAMLYVFQGNGLKIDGLKVDDGEMVILHDGDAVKFSLDEDAESHVEFLLLAGEPIKEPIVRHGPFVMNKPEEIKQAIMDFQNGKMGTIE